MPAARLSSITPKNATVAVLAKPPQREPVAFIKPPVREDVAAIIKHFEEQGSPIDLRLATAMADASKKAMDRSECLVPIIERHVAVLAEKERRLTYRGDYGEWRFEKWHREVGRFIDGVLQYEVAWPIKRNSDEWDAIQKRIDDAVSAYQRAEFEAEEARLSEEVARLDAAPKPRRTRRKQS